MTPYVVHTIPGSPAARAVIATLIEKDLPFLVAGLAPGEHKIEPHLSRHPFGKMPVIEQDGFSLYETQAILRYLDRVAPSPPLVPDDPRAAARMDQIMGISDWYLFQGVSSVIAFQRIVGPKLIGLHPDEAAIAAAMPRAHIVFGELSRFLDRKPFLCGDFVTLADLLVAPHVDFLAQTPEWTDLTRDRQNLIAWHRHISTRRSMAESSWTAVSEMAQKREVGRGLTSER